MTLNIWKAIADFCTNVLFKPYDYFSKINNNEHWWTANTINIILFLIVAVMFLYWFTQLYKFNKEGTED
ncbi:MAG TPA: uracil phosphoribosyltransferase [Flavobacteriia bacterium]|nr:uracil phosphoribosyltransferase [Flavobacteriia bacterium]